MSGIKRNTGAFIAGKAGSGLFSGRMRLQRERLSRCEQFDDERQFTDFVNQKRRSRVMQAVVDVCLTARVSAEPDFGPWSPVSSDLE
jgi:hypothetical protein